MNTKTIKFKTDIEINEFLNRHRKKLVFSCIFSPYICFVNKDSFKEYMINFETLTLEIK